MSTVHERLAWARRLRPGGPGKTSAASVEGAVSTHAPAVDAKAQPRRNAIGPGLYAILGVASDAPAASIHVAYRRRAAQLASSRSARPAQLKELNGAYGILGNPDRRSEYDQELTRMGARPAASADPSMVNGRQAVPAYPRFRHARRAAASGPALWELGGIALVLIAAVVAANAVLSRVSVDLSPLSALGRMAGIGGAPRPVLGDVPLAGPTATPSPVVVGTSGAPLSLREQFASSTISVADRRPAPGTTMSVTLKLVRNGQPAVGVPAWLTVQYRTTTERWPPSGDVPTDAAGSATIVFDLGDATLDFEARVIGYARVGNEELTWPATFTPSLR